MNWRIERYPILASTNDLALERLRTGTARPGDVLVAEEQLAGRGRPGRTWHSPRGALLCTVILPFFPERVGWTALAAGIAVAQAVRRMGAPAGVKWPNDVVLDGGKLAGILAETADPRLVAVGIGMNVRNPLPEDPALARRARRLADRVPDATPEKALEAILAELERCWPLLAAEDLSPLRSAWAALDTTVGRRLRWSERNLSGVAEGVAADGALLLRTADGRLLRAAVGEVTFVESPDGV